MMSLYSKEFLFMDKVNKLPQKQMVTVNEGLSEKLREGNLMTKLGFLGLVNDLTELRKLVSGKKQS